MKGLFANRFTKDAVLYSIEILAPVLLWSYISQPLRKILERLQVFHIFLGDQSNEIKSYNYLEKNNTSDIANFYNSCSDGYNPT
jgi:hypothetical protein